MNDSEFIFNETTRERSSLNSSARKRKIGSKSKSCRLGSDHMSKKELEKMNGPVKMFAMNMPCCYDILCQQEPDIIKEYLEGLVSKYAFCQYNFMRMLHIGSNKVDKLLDMYGVEPVCGHTRTDVETELAKNFMARTVSPNRTAAESIIKTILTEPETLTESSQEVPESSHNDGGNCYDGNSGSDKKTSEPDLLSSIMKLNEFTKSHNSVKMKFYKDNIETALAVLRMALNDYDDDDVITIKVHI